VSARSTGAFLLVIAASAGSCRKAVTDERPVRLAVGMSDTVIINNVRPGRLAVRALDSRGRTLPDSGVQYEWLSGATVSLSPDGVISCAQRGDATVRASLGPLEKRLVLRCRPVHEVRALRMMNLVIGEPAQTLPFAALDSAGRAVTMLTASVTVYDSSIATVQGAQVAGRRQGSTAIDMRIGDHVAHASVHVYQRVDTLGAMQPGDHVAIPLTLRHGETRRWPLRNRESYFVTLLPDASGRPLPRVMITGANCSPGFDAHSFFCLALKDAAVVVYHTPLGGPSPETSATLAIWRQE